jgi:hypothetical protein
VSGTGVISGTPLLKADPASVSPPAPIPLIEIEKFAGPVGVCEEGNMAGMETLKYNLPTRSSSWQFCYVGTVPLTSQECLSQVKMVDESHNGIGTYDVTTGAEELCPGDVVYIPGPVDEDGLEEEVEPEDVVISGVGVDSGNPAGGRDDAGVIPPTPVPEIAIVKYAGPSDKQCGVDMDAFEDITYNLPTRTSSWRYCYEVYVPDTPNGECLYAVLMSDNDAPNGIGSAHPITTGSDLADATTTQICPGGPSVFVAGPEDADGLESTEGPFDAEVSGVGVYSGISVSAVNPATVVPPTPVPLVEVKKYAGPINKCGVNMNPMADDTYNLPSRTESWQYCYKVSVPASSEECLYAMSMTDDAPSVSANNPIAVPDIYLSLDEMMCPGDERYVSAAEISGLTSTEGPFNVTVVGKGVISDTTVSDTDPATVVPPPPVPVIEVLKYAGPVGKCGVDMDGMEDVMFNLTRPDTEWEYCYVAAVPITSEECLYNVFMSDPAPIGGTKGIDIIVPGTMCKDDLPLYFSGSSHVGLEEREGPFDVTITGTGVESGKIVTYSDDASVIPYVPPPCLIDMGNTDEDVCPFNPEFDAVTVLHIKTDNNDIIPEDLDPSSLVYEMAFSGSAAAPEVSFKVNSPFDFDTDFYVQYHTKAIASLSGALDPACDSYISEPGCNAAATKITAGCIEGASGVPFALVSVFFISEDSMFKNGGDGVSPYECCDIPDADKSKPIIEYSFKVACGCPTTERLLRGGM